MKRLSVLFVVLPLVAGLVAALAPADEPQGGTLTGVLVAKGDNWIGVRADGATEVVKYWPFWRGGNEGGFDKDMVATIRTLVVPNRVSLTWKLEERPRIVSVTMLVPEQREGTLTGTISAKGETWIEVTPEGGATQRFWPRWIGGNPNQGGGFDKDMLRVFAGLTVGQKVSIRWTYDERIRAVQVTVVP